MSGRIQSLVAGVGATPAQAAGDAPATPAAAEATAAKTAKKKADLEMAAREFEQIFVRSMLKDTPIAGKGDAYGDLAVDALAKSVTAGRGLGLGDLIKRSVESSERALKDRG